MAIKTVYASKLGRNYKISENFTLSEFQSKDGADKVLYSEELLSKLELLRAYGGFTVHINSAYRTSSHNRKVGGASNSQHTKGTAADIVVYKDGKEVNAKKICCLCQTLGFKGIGYISSRSVHVDMRASGSYRGDERKGYSSNIGNDFYKYFGIKCSEIEDMKVVAKKATTTKTEQEEEEMIYKTIDDIPEWGKEATQRRIDAGATDGTNLNDSTVRCFVVEDRMNPFYADLKDVPKYWREDVSKMIEYGIICGDGKNQVGMTRSELKAVIVAYRLMMYANKLPKE